MSDLTRRSFIGRGLTSVATASLAAKAFGAAGASEPSTESEPLHEFGLTCLGKVKPVASRAIKASPLSVGFETLDRKHFDPKRTYPYLAKLGVKWARCQTGWCRCEPEAGRFDFAWLDEVVEGLLKIGVQPWFNLGYGNRLYCPDATDGAAVGCVPIFTKAGRDAWLRFTGRIVDRYKDRVRHWEIWNEPNIKTFWRPKAPDPADYVELVKITAAEIRRRFPQAIIIGGALAGIPISYLRGCLASGLADHVDKISYHPYRAIPEKGYKKQVEAFRQLVAAHNPRIRLWQGENGCPSKGGPTSTGALSKLQWTEQRQAKWLLRRILSDLALSVELTSYFHTIDLVGYRGKTNFKGLLRGADYTPKPAYAAYQCLCRLFDAQTQHKPDLTVELVGQKKVQLQEAWFSRGGRGLGAYWLPADLQKPYTPRRITTAIPAPQGASIDKPVLIDPLTSKTYALSGKRVPSGGWKLPDLPLMDYPLLITDASVV